MKRGVADRFSSSEQWLADRTNEAPQEGMSLKPGGELSKTSANKAGLSKAVRDLQLLAADVRQRYLADVAYFNLE